MPTANGGGTVSSIGTTSGGDVSGNTTYFHRALSVNSCQNHSNSFSHQFTRNIQHLSASSHRFRFSCRSCQQCFIQWFRHYSNQCRHLCHHCRLCPNRFSRLQFTHWSISRKLCYQHSQSRNSRLPSPLLQPFHTAPQPHCHLVADLEPER